jgi:hypothetical protein
VGFQQGWQRVGSWFVAGFLIRLAPLDVCRAEGAV